MADTPQYPEEEEEEEAGVPAEGAPGPNDAPPRLTSLHIRNYRCLKDFRLDPLQPVNVFIGANGSGKSTFIDALTFLRDCMTGGLQRALNEHRGGFNAVRSRGTDGPIGFTLNIDFSQDLSVEYAIEIVDEPEYGPRMQEDLQVRSPPDFPEFTNVLSIKRGIGNYKRKKDDSYVDVGFSIRDTDRNALPAVATKSYKPGTIGFSETDSFIRKIFSFHPEIFSLQTVIDEREDRGLSPDGSNLCEHLYYLQNRSNTTINAISELLSHTISNFKCVNVQTFPPDKMALMFHEQKIGGGFFSDDVSDGTKQLLMILTALLTPNPGSLLLLDEPEQFTHPQVLSRLAEEMQRAAHRMQIFVAHHSPTLLSAFEPEQCWILDRGETGYTVAKRAADIPGVKEYFEEGGKLGSMWMQGFFDQPHTDRR